MAQLDGSFYLQSQAPELKIGEGFERGMRLGDMMKERRAKDLEMQKKQQMDAAMKAGVVVNPDGTKSFNQDISIGEMMNVDPMAANKLKQDFQAQKVASLENENKLRSAVFEQTYGDVDFAFKNKGTPQAAKAWESAYDKAERLGYPMAGMSRIYDPNQTDTVYNSMLPMAKQRELEIQKQQNQARLEEARFNNGIKLRQVGLDEQKIKNEINKEAAKYGPKPVEKRLADLGAGEKQRLDYIKQGLDANVRMADALDNGDNTFSVIGDNDFTKAKREASEAYGRMQSGGAISLPEEERFDKTSPGATDKTEIQRKKLLDQQKMFLDRLDTMGFKPEELGIKVKDIQYGSKDAPKDMNTKIQSFMQKNGITDQQEAIRILKENGKL